MYCVKEFDRSQEGCLSRCEKKGVLAAQCWV